MARQVPGPAAENNDRILARDYDSDFAHLPDDEVVDVPAPGAGPAGSLDDGPQLPLLVIAAGAVVAFSAFFFDSVWPLAIGLVLVLAGAIWSGYSTPRHGSGAGLGPTTIDEG